MKATVYSIGRNGSDCTFVGTVFTAFSGKGCYLKLEMLHDALYFLFVYVKSLVLEFASHAPIAVVFMLAADFPHFIL